MCKNSCRFMFVKLSFPEQGISEGEHVHPGVRSKTPQISQESRLSGQVELHSPHMQHLQRERVQPEPNPTSYPSPTGVSLPIKHELSSPHQTLTPKQPSFISTQSSAPGAAPSPVISRTDHQTAAKPEPLASSCSQRPVDMVQLLTVSTNFTAVFKGHLGTCVPAGECKVK